MKKVLLTGVILLTTCAVSLNAWAGGPHDRPYGHGHGHGRGYEGHRGPVQRPNDWVAPLIVLGLAGAAISAAANAAPPAAVTYSTVPLRQMPPVPPANAGYFCNSVGQFYPYTTFCPEGWQLVMPAR
jgi:hypothetical protein